MNNMQKSPLQKAVERAHALGRRAVIPFITAGFPDKESFWTHLSRIDEAGADIIEIGVPFSDPVADGPVIEQASRDALARGVSLKWILDGLKARKGGFSAELVLMGYVNPFYRYGLKQLALDAEEAGVSGFIVPDMPLEESGMFREAFSPHGLTLVTLVAPNTSEERMREYKPYTSGFVYVVSVLGTTGGKANLERSVTETMRRARSVFDVPLALGFGELALSGPELLQPLGQLVVDGVELAEYRGGALWDMDKNEKVRFSHENTDIQTLYRDYLEKPCGERAHHLLHTDHDAWQMPPAPAREN